MDCKPFIEKLWLLEEKLGSLSNKTILDPFIFDSNSILEVQKAGSKIASHLGMSDCTFVITYKTQSKGTAGHVHVDASRDVFVEIDPRFRQEHTVVLYILAHEICHKFLYRNGIVLTPIQENEILTDIATVYAGLGKLALNGCEMMDSMSRKNAWSQGNLQRLGYINRYHFAYVYRVWCEMHKISPMMYFKHLSSEVIQTLQEVKKEEYESFSDLYYDPHFVFLQWTKNLKKDIEGIQNITAEIDRCQRLLNAPEKNPVVHAIHALTKDFLSTFQPENVPVSKRPALTYLHNVRGYYAMKLLQQRILADKKNLTTLLRNVSDESHRSTVAQSRKKISPEILRQFSCPVCNRAMSIGAFKLVRVVCPACSYVFIADTRLEIEKTPGNMAQIFKKFMNKKK